MAYGKQTEKNKPTLKDFEEQTSPQEKKLWNEYLKTYPEPFKRSALVVELEKFKQFGDTSSGSLGKKGDALRDLGLKRIAYTYREIDTDFEGTCSAIDRAVKREISQMSLVEIKKPVRLSLDDDDEPVKKGYKITVSGEDDK